MAASEIVVMKFGGTSVAEPDDIRRAAGRIVAARALHAAPVDRVELAQPAGESGIHRR